MRSVAAGLQIGTNWHVDVKDRIKSLRLQLGMTHQEVADRSGGNLKREEMVKLEGGRNKASTLRIRNGLAMGFGTSNAEIEQMIEGTLSPDVLAARIKSLRGGKVVTKKQASQADQAAPVVGKLNQLPQWEDLLTLAKILEPHISDEIWVEVGEAHPTFAKPPTPRTLVWVARMVIEDMELSAPVEPLGKPKSGS